MSFILVIAGMHRSGTSLVASLIEHAGVNLGAQLVPPASDNPLGFFEDAEIVQFHEDILHARGQNILVNREFRFELTDAEKARAHALIRSRANLFLWGWKDPRTCLLLDFWNEALPDARFLLLYRHPLDVVVSLARRIEVVGFDLYVGLEAWYAYNARLAEFARIHPKTTLVCSSYSVLTSIETLRALLGERLGLELELTPELRDRIYKTEQLHRVPRSTATQALLRLIHPDALNLFDDLQRSAALSEQEPLQTVMPELDTLSRFAGLLSAPLSLAQRRALLTMLVASTDPVLYERFASESVQRTAELEAQRRAWRESAEERAALLREQSAWDRPRLAYLKRLESSSLVRALVRLGLLPKSQ